MAETPYAELHSHTNFSFLDGASAPDDLVERAGELGLRALAITDHAGLYGAVRFVTSAETVGLHPVVGVEIELLDPAVEDPTGIVVPRPRRRGRGRGIDPTAPPSEPSDGVPIRPRTERLRLPGHRDPVKEDLRGITEGVRGPHLVLLARSQGGWRSLCRLVSHAHMSGTKGVPRFSHALLAEHTEGLVALSGCRDGEIARRLRAGDRAGARATAEHYVRLFGRGDAPATSGCFIELSHHLRPDDDWLVEEAAALADALGLPVVVTNDVHYAKPEDRELADVLAAIRHGRTLDTLGDLRRPDGEAYLKDGEALAALGRSFDARTARAWSSGIANAVELAASCSIDLGFEQYRFPGFPVPSGETPFSYLSELCWAGARKRYHPMTSEVVKRLAHELDVIERAGLAEFFLICWDLMRHAKEQGIPAQGRGSATSSIVSYTLGISRVEPIAHNLLFERFINEGRTTYPDVDIDFSSERREEVIQYVYKRYGPEHTGMVCNLVTYRARSAVREVGYALGFPRPLVDRVAKALETYDSVMVRRDLEAEGGFAEFFKRPGEDGPAGERAAQAAEGLGFVDGMGQLQQRVPLVGKVPPWRQPQVPPDPNAPRPFAWLGAANAAADDGPSRSGTWEGAPESPPSIRPGGRHDDEGGPGDTPASVAWLRAGRGTGYEADRDRLVAPALVQGRELDPESGMPLPPPRQADRLGRPSRWDSSDRWLAGASPRSSERPMLLRPTDRTIRAPRIRETRRRADARSDLPWNG